MQPQHLFLWRRTALEQIGPLTVASDQPPFVPVAMEGARRSPASQSVPDHNDNRREIGIDLWGVSLRIPIGVSADHIGRVFLWCAAPDDYPSGFTQGAGGGEASGLSRKYRGAGLVGEERASARSFLLRAVRAPQQAGSPAQAAAMGWN
jgi:hypothetical protein